mgnify:CR=1 FL=1
MIEQLLLAIPPATEQESLVKELNRETTRIDALIAKKKALLDKLAEKRTALISLCVAAGMGSAMIIERV